MVNTKKFFRRESLFNLSFKVPKYELDYQKKNQVIFKRQLKKAFLFLMGFTILVLVYICILGMINHNPKKNPFINYSLEVLLDNLFLSGPSPTIPTFKLGF